MISARAVAAGTPHAVTQCLTQLDPSSGISFNAGDIVAVNCNVGTNGTVSV